MLGTEVVLVYRCGAVPEFRRVPFTPERMPRHQSRPTTYRGSGVQVNKMLCVGAREWKDAGLCHDNDERTVRSS